MAPVRSAAARAAARRRPGRRDVGASSRASSLGVRGGRGLLAGADGFGRPPGDDGVGDDSSGAGFTRSK
jgi:hypothetical protein